MLAKPQPWWPGINRQHRLAYGLQAFMPLWEGAGVVAHDLVEPGSPGEFKASPDWAGSLVGQVVEFNRGGTPGGSSDYIEIPSRSRLDGGQGLTVAVLCRNHKSEISGTGDERLVEKEGTGSDSYNLLWAGNENVTFTVGVSGGNTTATYTAGIPAGEGDKWHMVVGTYDGANIRIYVDGVLGVTTPLTGAVNATSHSLMIGSDLANNSWDGWIGLLAIWDRALPAGLVRQLSFSPFDLLRIPSIAQRFVAAVGIIPYPYPRYAMTGGMQPVAGGIH